jgi:hypothetical protein
LYNKTKDVKHKKMNNITENISKEIQERLNDYKTKLECLELSKSQNYENNPQYWKDYLTLYNSEFLVEIDKIYKKMVVPHLNEAKAFEVSELITNNECHDNKVSTYAYDDCSLQ